MGRERWLILAAFAVIYFVWGSTYLANYWAISTIPPFLMCGSRFLLAGLLLFVFTWPKRADFPTLRQWANSAVIGLLFLGLGTAAVVWAQQFIPTSLTALMVAFEPLVIMVFMWWLIDSRPSKRAFSGAFISIGGVSLLIGQPELGGNPDAFWALIAVATGLTAWALGAIYVSRVDMGKNRIRATGMQMMTGGAQILLFSLLLGEYREFDPAALGLQSVLSWSYLVVFGSILAFSSFNFLLSRVSPEKVATSTYVNPVVALILGGWLNQEVISQQSLIAGGVMLTGVYFINSAK